MLAPYGARAPPYFSLTFSTRAKCWKSRQIMQMRPERRGLMTAAVAIAAVVLVVGSAYFFLPRDVTSLPLPAGNGNSKQGVNVTFTVSGTPGHVARAGAANRAARSRTYPSEAPPSRVTLR